MQIEMKIVRALIAKLEPRLRELDAEGRFAPSGPWFCHPAVRAVAN